MATDYTNIIDDVVAKNIIAVLRAEDKFSQIKINQDYEIISSGSVWFNLLPLSDEHYQYTTAGEDRFLTFSLRIYLKTGKLINKSSFNRLSDWCERIKRVLKDSRNYRSGGTTYWSDLKVLTIDYNPSLTDSEEELQGIQIAELTLQLWNQERDS